MSNLQILINDLIQVIIDYWQSQTDIKYNLENITVKSNDELNKELTNLIDQATKTHPTRKELLHYFLYVIKTVKPITDSLEALNEEQENQVKKVLVSLLSDVQILRETNHGTKVNVAYNNHTYPMFGLKKGRTAVVLTYSEQVMRKLFTKHNISKEPEGIEKFINDTIVEHQVFRKYVKQVSELQNKHLASQEKLKIAEVNSAALSSELRLNLEQIEKKYNSELENANQQISELSKCKSKLESTIIILSSTNQNIIKENDRLNTQFRKLNDEVLQLQECKSKLENTINQHHDLVVSNQKIIEENNHLKIQLTKLNEELLQTESRILLLTEQSKKDTREKNALQKELTSTKKEMILLKQESSNILIDDQEKNDTAQQLSYSAFIKDTLHQYKKNSPIRNKTFFNRTEEKKPFFDHLNSSVSTDL